jgi:hypothetical protein
MSILDCLDRAVQKIGSKSTWLEQLLGLQFHQCLTCSACGKVTRRLDWTQLQELVQAILVRQWGFDGAIKMDKEAEMRTCSKEDGGCGQAGFLTTTLDSAIVPRLFAVAVSWDTSSCSAEDLEQFLQRVPVRINLKSLYNGLENEATALCEFTLRSLVCYYGSHYMAYALDAEQGGWLYFDDLTMRVVGGWEDVLANCKKGRQMPVVLVFQNQFLG